jgi:hypothetical protein
MQIIPIELKDLLLVNIINSSYMQQEICIYVRHRRLMQ